MTNDIEKKLYAAADSAKMKGFGDKLERLIYETERSAGLTGARALSDDELEMVAGGMNSSAMKRVGDKILGDMDKGSARTGITPKGGLTC